MPIEQHQCSKCQGKGKYLTIISEPCSICDGSGMRGGRNSTETVSPCDCDNGKTMDVECEECQGTGWVNRGPSDEH